MLQLCLSLLVALSFAADIGRKPSSSAPPHDPDYIPPIRALAPVEGVKVLTITSWNVKHLGRKGFDSARAVPLLLEADIVTLQEVNASQSGLDALNRMAAELQRLTKQKICKALSETPSGGKERYAYLWKDTRVAYVKTNGDIMDTCPATHLTIRLGVKHEKKILREPAFGTFFFRAEARPFVLASIHLRPSGKRPQDEAPPLFETFHSVLLPAIVAGDYNLDSPHTAFAKARELKFRPAMSGVKTSLKMKKRELNKPYDNFWFRDVTLVSSKVIDLFAAFPALSPKEIYKNLSDHAPISAQFKFAAASERALK